MGARAQRRQARPRPRAQPKLDFDVREGHQSPWVGVLGAVFILALFAGYTVHALYELPGAGPPVAELFSFLPERFRFHDVNRNFFDLLGMVALLFVFMACWEVHGPAAKRSRAVLAGVAASGVVAVWLCPPFVQPLGGAALTSIELVLIGIAAGMLVAAGVGRRSATRSEPRARRTAWPLALRAGLARFLSLYVLVTAAWLVYVTTPYYVRSEEPPFTNWRIAVTLLWILFGIVGLPYAIWTMRVGRGRVHDFSDPGLLLLLVYKRLLLGFGRDGFPKLRRLANRRVRTALLDLGVKAFFLPLMVTFLFLEAGNFASHLLQLANMIGSEAGWSSAASDPFLKASYGMLRASLYIVDVSVGLLGYACAFWWLHNKSKSVESTFGGWLAALACYPPLTLVTTLLLPFERAPGAGWELFQVAAIQNALLVVSLLCHVIYVWATLAFGLRFSNLTNRGIITRGPYRYVRHPAYSAKVVSWWCEAVPVFGSVVQLLFFSGWVGIYFLRAVTEERHLKADPCYGAYCAAVKHRFVPGLW